MEEQNSATAVFFERMKGRSDKKIVQQTYLHQARSSMHGSRYTAQENL